MDGDFGERRVDWLEAPPQLFKIGQPARVDLGGERIGKFGFAGPFMREGEQPNDGATGFLLRFCGDQRVEGARIGGTREELVAIDKAEKRHRLLFGRMNDVPVVDDMTTQIAVGRPRRRVRTRVEPSQQSR